MERYVKTNQGKVFRISRYHFMRMIRLAGLGNGPILSPSGNHSVACAILLVPMCLRHGNCYCVEKLLAVEITEIYRGSNGPCKLLEGLFKLKNLRDTKMSKNS